MTARTAVVLVALLGACAHAPPNLGDASGALPAPHHMWTPPSARSATSLSLMMVDSVGTLATLSLSSAVELALRNNPATRISWTDVRAAADRYGVSRGALYPTVAASLSAGSTQTTTSGNGLERTQYGPSASLSYLVFDFGGRRGAIESARATAIAAGYAHNAAIQSTILAAESAAFSYLSVRALRDAQRATFDDATAILAAADERHRVGVATIADVYQARTARAQEGINLESLEGALNVARGTLAVVLGLPATASIELTDITPADSATVTMTAASVDSILAFAVQNNPALGVARAAASRAIAERQATRASAWPSLALGATTGYIGSNRSTVEGRNYALTLGFSIPLFNGFATTYAARAADEDIVNANARELQVRRSVELQVFTSYYALQTVTKRVRSAADLLANAEASERVARGRYTEGVGNIVDLLIAQSALANARAQSLAAGWEWRTALAQLAHDAGALDARGQTRAPISAPSQGNR